MAEKKIQIIQKIKKNYKYFVLAFVFGTTFYAYEFLDNHSKDYNESKTSADVAHKQNSVSLNSVKDYAKGTEVYENYLKANSIKKTAVKKFMIAKKSRKDFWL